MLIADRRQQKNFKSFNPPYLIHHFPLPLSYSRGRSSFRGRGRSNFRHDRPPNMPMTVPPTDYNNYQAPPMATSGYDDGQYHLPPRYAMIDFIFILCVDRCKFDLFLHYVFGRSVIL